MDFQDASTLKELTPLEHEFSNLSLQGREEHKSASPFSSATRDQQHIISSSSPPKRPSPVHLADSHFDKEEETLKEVKEELERTQELLRKRDFQIQTEMYKVRQYTEVNEKLRRGRRKGEGERKTSKTPFKPTSPK